MNDTTFQGNGSVKYVPVVVDAKPKPITNAMKIRAMSDEELAEWISCNCTGDGYGNSAEDWLDWLRQEVNDGKEGKEENQPAK